MPLQSWKPAVASIRGDPFAPRFDRKCCEIRVRHEVALDPRCPAETDEDFPVPGPGEDENAVWSIAEDVRKRESYYSFIGLGTLNTRG
jgi:hypothetical protein